MNILMISPVPISPANVGDRVRIKHIALGMAKYHDITFVAPIYEGEENEEKEHIQIEKIINYHPIRVKPVGFVSKIGALFSRWPYHTKLRYSSVFDQQVKSFLKEGKFDLIYCHLLQTLPYVVPITSIPIVLDQQNVDAMYWERQTRQYTNVFLIWLAKQNLKKTVQFEQDMLPYLSGIVSVSEADRQATQKYAKKKVSHFFVANNGVDTTAFQLGKKNKNNSKLVLGFFGSMDLKYNEDGALELIKNILPLVQKQLPKLVCSAIIIGRNPSQKLKEISRQSMFDITVTGTVEEVLPHLHQVDILVLPLSSGAGTKLRIAEAMAAGIPIVGSALAVIGFEEFVTNKQLLLAESTEEFATQISYLALNPAYQKEIVKANRALAEQEYSWKWIATKLSSDVEQLLNV